MMKRFPEYGRDRSVDSNAFPETLRHLIVGRIHAGWLNPGDRLPSIREVASESRVDHRVAARAYRMLEREGLVEVRAKTGVFVAPSLAPIPHASGDGSWAADLLFEGWQRRISRSALCGLFGGSLNAPLRCGCIESNRDHLVALVGEIEDGLSLEMVPMLVPATVVEGSPPPEEIDDVDILVTSVFHAAYARQLAAEAGKPLAVLNVSREFSGEIGKRLSLGPVTAVIADPEYATRATEYFSAIGIGGQVRFLSPRQAKEEALDPSDPRVLITRAARRRMGLEDFHLVPAPMISTASARALCEIVTSAAPKRRPRLRIESTAASRRAAGESAGTRRVEAAQAEVREVVETVERTLRERGLFEALRALNRSTTHRFTGVYRFETGWVRSVALVDRENPDLSVGADVPMKESYCAITADQGQCLTVENAATDGRLQGHPASGAVLSYCAVHLHDAKGASWGTLCHYDFRPSVPQEATLRALEALRPAFERVLGPATEHALTLPDCVKRRRASRPRTPALQLRLSAG